MAAPLSLLVSFTRRLLDEESLIPPMPTTPYDPFEHRHRFASWAAARAAQRGFTSVERLRRALDRSGIDAFLRTEGARFTMPQEFDRLHAAWSEAILQELSDLPGATYGRAAKLIAVYLKTMVVLGPDGISPLAYAVHPPIDAILLRNLAKSPLGAEHAAHWRAVRWTKLDREGYLGLIEELRGLVDGAPFWTLERFWDPSETTA